MRASRPLFDSIPNASGLLAWLPDESLYSWCSRMHGLRGYRLPAQTSQLLFGASRLGWQHDLPSHIDAFVASTAGLLGDAGTVCRQRTLLKFYRRFLSGDDEESACATMRCGPVVHLKLKLGLLTSRFRAHHPLKACPLCVASDLEKVGWAYWHLRHQLPGVWVCTKHDEPLIEAAVKANGVQRFGWCLPSQRLLSDCSVPRARLGKSAVTSLRRFAEVGEQLVATAFHYRLDRSELHATYRRALEQRGLAAVGGSIRLAEAGAALCEHVQPLRNVPELSALPMNLTQAKTQLTRLLAAERGHAHPLRHLMMIDWLFGGIDALLDGQAADVETRQRVAAAGTDIELDEVPGCVRGAVIARLITEEGVSARALAQRFGVSTKTIMVMAAREGVHVQRRSKILKTELLRRMTKSLQCGNPKAQVAAEFGVSVTTVTTTLQTIPELSRQWHCAVHERRRKQACRDWLSALKRFGQFGVTAVRREVSAAYAWLYRNDPSWLRQHLPASCKRVVPANRVDWAARDASLSSEVRRAALALRKLHGTEKLKLWQLYQAVPELRAKLRKLDRLPLTAQAVKTALR